MSSVIDHIIGWSQSTILNGERSSAATSYLALPFRQRPNLHILLHAHATRILQKSASQSLTFNGVEFTQDGGRLAFEECSTESNSGSLKKFYR